MSVVHVQQREPSKREEELLSSLHDVLQANNYQWDGQTAMKTGEPLPSATHTLKELLVSRAVEMEATTSTNVSTMFTLTSEPAEEVESFEKLVKFCDECASACRAEVAQVIYPVFVHVYIHFFSLGHKEHVQRLKSDSTVGLFDSSQRSELMELFACSSPEELLSLELVNKFKNKKFSLRMSDKAFHLLMQFLQVLYTPFLLTVIQQYLTIEVYGNTPMVAVDNSKQDTRKIATFNKPRVRLLDENRRLIKTKVPPRPSTGFVLASQSDNDSTLSTPSGARLTEINEFKEKLTSSEVIDQTAPSIAVYCIHSTDNSVHCAALSDMSMQYACGFADSSIHLWSRLPNTTSNSATNHMIRTQPVGLPDSDHHSLIGHSGPVYGTCFNASGEYLLSSSEDNSVRLWDTQTHVCAVNYQGHTYPVWDVSFSPVDVHFASASMDQTARLWTTDLTFPLRIFAGHSSSVDVVRFHPNGQYIATGSHDRTCRLWDIQSGQCVRLMTGSKSSVLSIAFSPNGKQLISGGTDGIMRVWDLGSGGMMEEYQPSLHLPNRGVVSALAFSPDGALLASSTNFNCVRIYNGKQLGTSNNSGTGEVLLLEVTPKLSSILQLKFTHRNCLIAITKLVNTTKPHLHHNMTNPTNPTMIQ